MGLRGAHKIRSERFAERRALLIAVVDSYKRGKLVRASESNARVAVSKVT
jgi:hypothetical protein